MFLIFNWFRTKQKEEIIIQPYELIPSKLIKQEISNDSYMDNEYVIIEKDFFFYFYYSIESQ